MHDTPSVHDHAARRQLEHDVDTLLDHEDGQRVAGRHAADRRNQLLDIAYSDDVYVDDRTIDSHIKRIRRKFRAVDPAFDSIDTLYGVGYRFDQP